MAIKTTYLVSCLVLLANCNVRAICNVGCEDSQLGSTGYFASGSAHSSQYVLPSGEVVTRSKGSSFSSDGIQKTFETLKHEANQFVSKQKDSLNVPNVLPPLHSSFGQDLQSLQSLGSEAGYPAQGYYNQLESASHQKQFQSTAGSQNSQIYYPLLPQTSKVTSTKNEQVVVNKKVFSTRGSNSYGTSGLEEIETNQNGLDSNLNGESLIYQQVPSYTGNVHVQSGNKQEEVETVRTNAKLTPVVLQKIQVPSQSQTSFGKYEQHVKQNASSQIVPGIPAYIPNGQFTTGLLDLNTVLSRKTPNKHVAPVALEQHYSVPVVPEHHSYSQTQSHNEESESTVHEDVSSSFNSDVNSRQKEQKYDAIPVLNKVADLPVKIKYIYDGKTLHKYEEFSSGFVKEVPITVEERENIFKEVQKESASHTSQSYVSNQPVSHEKPESDGYYYYPKPSTVQTFKKEQSQSTHSQQSIANGNVEQFSHLPLNVNSQKQYYSQQAGYQGVIPPSSSQISYEGSDQTVDAFNSHRGIPNILVQGVPQLVPVQSQHSSSSSSGSTFHSTSASGSGTSGSFVFPSDSLASSQTGGNLLEKISSLNTSGSKLSICGSDCLTDVVPSNLPAKNSYGISTSFSSSSSNINGKKTENRQASVTVNDNGKVDTYNVKS